MKIRTEIKTVVSMAVLFFFGLAFLNLVLVAPKNFPVGGNIVIEKGLTLAEISSLLKKEDLIRNKYIFALYAILSNKSKKIKYGRYLFSEPFSVFSLTDRLTKGEFGTKPVKVVVREGLMVKKIAELFVDFENFDREEFLVRTKGLEGFIFPDTYLFLPDVRTDQIIKTMNDNFKKKVGDVGKDIVIMASLIEKEVPGDEDRRIISGVLWKRLEIGMPLQVDAVFPYIKNGENGPVTFNDLKIDSPYNTYLHKGLPPGPIANPSLNAINAALNPIKSPYLFYLSGKDGRTYFAKTYEEHLKNKKKYLK